MPAEQERDYTQEQEQYPFHTAARFPNESRAGRAYFRIQELILRNRDVDLSVFRIQLDKIYHVALVGETPPQPVADRIQRILASGEAVTLAANLVRALARRKAQASSIGPWVERDVRFVPPKE